MADRLATDTKIASEVAVVPALALRVGMDCVNLNRARYPSQNEVNDALGHSLVFGCRRFDRLC
jgi:hypothetical protein